MVEHASWSNLKSSLFTVEAYDDFKYSGLCRLCCDYSCSMRFVNFICKIQLSSQIGIEVRVPRGRGVVPIRGGFRSKKRNVSIAACWQAIFNVSTLLARKKLN